MKKKYNYYLDAGSLNGRKSLFRSILTGITQGKRLQRYCTSKTNIEPFHIRCQPGLTSLTCTFPPASDPTTHKYIFSSKELLSFWAKDKSMPQSPTVRQNFLIFAAAPSIEQILEWWYTYVPWCNSYPIQKHSEIFCRTSSIGKTRKHWKDIRCGHVSPSKESELQMRSNM